MNATPATRRLLSEMLIAASVCGAGYYFLVDNARAKIFEVRKEIAAVQAQQSTSGISTLTDQQVADVQRMTAERVKIIADRSAAARNETVLFENISVLAATYGVRINTLNPVVTPSRGIAPVLPPGVQPGTPAAAQAMAESAAQPQVRDVKSGYTITLHATYSDLTGFIGALREKLGYTVVKSIQTAPENELGAGLVRATLMTEHFAFDVSGVNVPVFDSPTLQPMPIPSHAHVEEDKP